MRQHLFQLQIQVVLCVRRANQRQQRVNEQRQQHQQERGHGKQEAGDGGQDSGNAKRGANRQQGGHKANHDQQADTGPVPGTLHVLLYLDPVGDPAGVHGNQPRTADKPQAQQEVEQQANQNLGAQPQAADVAQLHQPFGIGGRQLEGGDGGA